MNPNATQPAKEQSYLRNASATKVSVTKTIVIPAGAAGAVVDFDFPARPITSAGGADIGGVGDTSIVLGSSATFDTLVNFKEDANLAQGEYYVNHLTGRARGCKKDTGTSVSATFGVWAMKTMTETDEDESVVSTTMQSAVSATGNGTSLNVQGMATAVLLIAGTFVATVSFEGSIDDSTWSPIFACKLGVGTLGASTTSTGLYRLPVAGLKSIRARVTWTSGTSITISGRASALSSSGEDAAFAALIEKLGGESIDRDVILVTEEFNSTRITTATTTLCRASGGVLGGFFIEVALTAAVTLYDALTATGTPPVILPIGFPAGFHKFPRKLTTGACVVTAGADRIVVFTNS